MTGPTGVGKTWLACAFAHKACQSGHTSLYCRLPRLLQSLALARGVTRNARRIHPDRHSSSAHRPRPGWHSPHLLCIS
ncbi:MAG: ATP-binding protein [Granulosicoccus sp.]